MPTVKLILSKKLERTEKENAALQLTTLVAKELGKPESVTQAVVTDDAVISFGGNFIAPSAFVVVMNIGPIKPEISKKLSIGICALLNKYGISGQRTYINFCEKHGAEWGWNSEIF